MASSPPAGWLAQRVARVSWGVQLLLSLTDPVCSNCGSDRLGAIQRGIDNWPVAQCYECGPRTSLIPELDGTEKTRLKRKKALRAASRNVAKSKSAIHTVLRPLVERSAYRPKQDPKPAETISMFDT